MTAKYFINNLQLQPHPEGGFFKETYRSSGTIALKCLPPYFNGERSYATSIYFLLQQGHFSAFHRIASDECWHFYEGGALLIHIIDKQGTYSCIRLGRKTGEGEFFQFVVPAHCWFASEPAPGTEFSLVGCTVSPGFDFADFEMADKKLLSGQFPQYHSVVNRLCR